MKTQLAVMATAVLASAQYATAATVPLLHERICEVRGLPALSSFSVLCSLLRPSLLSFFRYSLFLPILF